MKIPSLQALRALAAAMVVVYHAQAEAAVLAARTQAPFTPSALLPWDAGVDIFFVISGFIIVHAAGPLYGAAGGRRRFLAHRVARVVPLYWLVTAAYLAVALGQPGLLSGGTGANGLDPAYVAASFLFWPMARADGTPVPLFGLGWTLNCEMVFYLLFALGLGWGRRAALAWLLASLVLLAAARALVPAMPMPLAFWTSPILLEFAFGALLALARDRGVRLDPTLQVLTLVLAFGFLARATEPGLAMRPLAYGLPAAALVACSALGRDAGAGRRAARWIVALGDASYALYLTHPFVLRAGREAILRLGLAPAIGPWGTLAILVVLACLASLAVHRFIETPLSLRARALLDPRAGRDAAKALEAEPARVSEDAKRV